MIIFLGDIEENQRGCFYETPCISSQVIDRERQSYWRHFVGQM